MDLNLVVPSFARWLAFAAGGWLVAACAALAAQVDSSAEIRVAIGQGKAVVSAGEDLFTEYDFASYARPILYPLLGPGQIHFTRHWPMRDDIAGEAHDHPHHKSVWFAHGDVNGLDFWSEKARIENESIETAPEDPSSWPGIVAGNRWMGPDGVVCREVATLRFRAEPTARFVDCAYRIYSERTVTFGDTKEGTFALRTHPALNLKKSAEDAPEPGHAENSQGERDGALWGRPARWVCYFGVLDGTPGGIAVFDHPGNLRHPTTWHARDYGLVAANPFGLHDFLAKPAGEGKFVLLPKQTLTLRYQIVLFSGEFDRNQVEGWYRAFAQLER
jgi:hypothetical protein